MKYAYYSMSQTAFIYSINCPNTNIPVYIGKTVKPKERFRKHLSHKKITRLTKWIYKLRKEGKTPVFEIIDEVADAVWQEAERGYIRLFKSVGAKLLNETMGGEGGATMTGKRLTPEQVLKIAANRPKKPRIDLVKNNTALKGFKIDQFDLSGNYIATHDSMRIASKAINRDSRRKQLMISGEKSVNHVGGFIFKKHENKL